MEDYNKFIYEKTSLIEALNIAIETTSAQMETTHNGQRAILKDKIRVWEFCKTQVDEQITAARFKCLPIILGYYQIREDDFFSKRQIEELVLARKLFCYIANKHEKRSKSSLARFLHKNLSTVIYGIETVEWDIENTVHIRRDYKAILSYLNI